MPPNLIWLIPRIILRRMLVVKEMNLTCHKNVTDPGMVVNTSTPAIGRLRQKAQ
jgi:hypothetical protein